METNAEVAKVKSRGVIHNTITKLKENEDSETQNWSHRNLTQSPWRTGIWWKLCTALVIRNSHSSWSVPIILLPKGDGGNRLVIDYSALDKVTSKFVLACARSNILPIEQSQVFLTFMLDITISNLWKGFIQKPLLIHHLANTNL